MRHEIKKPKLKLKIWRNIEYKMWKIISYVYHSYHVFILWRSWRKKVYLIKSVTKIRKKIIILKPDFYQQKFRKGLHCQHNAKNTSKYLRVEILFIF